MGLYDKCIRYLQNLLQDSDENNISRIHFHIADVYDNNDDYESAFKHLEISYNLLKDKTSTARFKELVYI